MLGFVSKFVSERDGSPEDGEAGDPRDGRPPTRLYECPDCESVYLSEAQSTCRSCDASVDQVPTERDLGYGTRSR